MKDKGIQKPAIQVLERSFALFDVLASHQDPVSLKQISAQTGLHPSTAHRILNDLAMGGFVDRPARRQLPSGHAPAGTGQPGQGPAGRARGRPRPDARAAQADAPAGEPVDAPGRRDRLHRTHLQRTFGHAGGAGDRWACAAAPDLGGQAVPGHGRPAEGARLRHAHRPGRAHAQQHHRVAGAGARIGQRAQAGHGARRRGAGDGRALHGGRHLRRPEQADRRAVDLGTGRPPGRRLDGARQGHRRTDLIGAGPPRG